MQYMDYYMDTEWHSECLELCGMFVFLRGVGMSPLAFFVAVVAVAVVAFLAGRGSIPKIPGRILGFHDLPLGRKMIICGRVDGYATMLWVRFEGSGLKSGFLVDSGSFDEVPEIGSCFEVDQVKTWRGSEYRKIVDHGGDISEFARPTVPVGTI